MAGTVNVALEGNPLVSDFSEGSQRKNLKSSRVREKVLVPQGKAVKPTSFFYNIHSRPQVQMVGVGKKNLKANFFQIILCHGLDGGTCSHWHKHGSANLTMGKLHDSSASLAGSVSVELGENRQNIRHIKPHVRANFKRIMLRIINKITGNQAPTKGET